MRFCQEHWDKLRDAIEDEGLGHLIARDGHDAATKMVDALERESTTLANFEPLMTAHWAIIERISKHASGVLFVEGCPLCWVQDEHEAHCAEPGCEVTRQTFEEWIPGVAAHMGREWQRLKSEAAT